MGDYETGFEQDTFRDMTFVSRPCLQCVAPQFDS